MKKIHIKIKGITCETCRNKIKKSLLKKDNVCDVSFNRNIAAIKFEKEIDINDIIESIVKLGYFTDTSLVSKTPEKLITNIKDILLICFLAIVISILLNKIFNFNIFNVIPVIDTNLSLGMLFVTGLLTSIHCVSMCGAINLVASAASKDLKKPVLYNLGRLVSYTVIGGIVGLIGSVFSVNLRLQGIIIIIASLGMLLMALNIMGLTNFKINFKFGSFGNKGSFVIGLLNGLIPCGPLQAMQVYALSTGSFYLGALSMFVFSLGTIPLMLTIGLLSNTLTHKTKIIANKVSVALIILLSLTMMYRGLINVGLNLSNVFKPNYDNYIIAEVKDGYQEIKFDLSYGGYKDILVQKNVPVKMIIIAKPTSLTGCNNVVNIDEFNISKGLKSGENVIEFTPDKTGTFIYTCWMTMLENKIRVIDDEEIFRIDK